MATNQRMRSAKGICALADKEGGYFAELRAWYSVMLRTE